VSNKISNSNSHYLCSSDDHFVEPSELDATEMTSPSVGLSTLWTCLTIINKRVSGHFQPCLLTVVLYLQWPQRREDKKSSIGNWIQCQEVLDTGAICGKWRR
jgi:hypothetical protein